MREQYASAKICERKPESAIRDSKQRELSIRAGDPAAQYLDMVNTNQRHLHLTPIEEAGALFAASQAGASKTRIRKATGLGKDHVGAALAA